MAVRKITSLTFEHGPLFTHATDQSGNTYRVLYASGVPGSRFWLQPWVAQGMPTWRGRSIDAGNPLYAAIQAFEDERKELEAKRPVEPGTYARLMADEI